MSVIDSNKFNISIHALREESDELLYNDKFKINISIHALREESDIMRCWKYTTKKAFQSTLSVRRATGLDARRNNIKIYFNPRSPWGERQSQNAFINRAIDISIHALREESDLKWQPLSVEEAKISIHALREESDYKFFPFWLASIIISIHALREESDNNFYYYNQLQ